MRAGTESRGEGAEAESRGDLGASGSCESTGIGSSNNCEAVSGGDNGAFTISSRVTASSSFSSSS